MHPHHTLVDISALLCLFCFLITNLSKLGMLEYQQALSFDVLHY